MKIDFDNPIHRAVVEDLREFGTLIKEARLRRDIPFSYLTEETGLSRATLARIERGDPGVSVASVFAVISVIKGNQNRLLDVVREPLCKSIEESVRHYPRKRSRRT